MAYKVPPLRFAYDALEPHIDAETMELHHDRHHRTLALGAVRATEQEPLSAPLVPLNSNRWLKEA